MRGWDSDCADGNGKGRLMAALGGTSGASGVWARRWGFVVLPELLQNRSASARSTNSRPAYPRSAARAADSARSTPSAGTSR